MIATLRSRGPDGVGCWSSTNGQAAIAHRRLAIIDLSESGSQPMLGDRYVLCFNGEVYNYQSLRKELLQDGAVFVGDSDTEVLLRAIEMRGLQQALTAIEGMFAFCVYDQKSNRAYLARDRMGEKPLYYAKENGRFFFASELKAIKAHQGFSARINAQVLPLYFNNNAIPAPYSIYENCFKLEPGTYLSLNCANLEFSIQHYWSSKQAMLAGAAKPFEGSELEAADHLDALLREVVREQMISDVPLGAFLSGGIDSSTVVSVMQSVSSHPVNSFSIGFQEKGYNEAEFAKQIALHLGTHHTELYVSDHDAKSVIPELPRIYCEPFADSSQIPTYLVSKLAKSAVTVALSGDGGDELFGGYKRYQRIIKSYRRRRPRLMEHLAYRMKPEFFDALMFLPLSLIGKYPKFASQRMRAKYYTYSEKQLAEFYRRAISYWPDIQLPMAESVRGLGYALRGEALQGLEQLDPLTLFQTLDMGMYLPDVILTKVDRAAMAVSLETRVPLLNHRVVEFAASLPSHYRNLHGVPKWPLQEVLSRYVPKAMFDRPKKGFSVPVGPWLNGSLKDWMLDMLSHDRIKRQGLFDYQKLQPVVQAQLAGAENNARLLWSMLMFQSWYDEYC